MIEPMVVIILIMAFFSILLLVGMPIFVCLGLSGGLGLFLLNGMPGVTILGRTPFYSLYSFELVAVPLFIFMGEIFLHTQISSKLYALGTKWVGGLPGGLAQATVAAAAVFGAMSGSAMAGAATIGLIAIPEMDSRGYSKPLATGVVAAAGPLATLIPPSINMILYCAIVEESVGALFIAGVIPGVILAILMMSYIGIHCTINPSMAPKAPGYSWKERFSSLKTMWAPVFLIIAVLGSIYAGIATPTEAAAVGVVTALLMAGFAYRTLNLRVLKKATRGAMLTTAKIFIIIVCAKFFSHFVAEVGLTTVIRDFVLNLGPSTYLVLIMLMFIYVILGCFLDPLSIMYITLPILLPTFAVLGISFIWLGILVIINLEIANITPPFGLTLFVVNGITGVPVSTIVRGIIPFMYVHIAMLAIVLAFPQLALWLPSTMQ